MIIIRVKPPSLNEHIWRDCFSVALFRTGKATANIGSISRRQKNLNNAASTTCFANHVSCTKEVNPSANALSTVHHHPLLVCYSPLLSPLPQSLAASGRAPEHVHIALHIPTVYFLRGRFSPFLAFHSTFGARTKKRKIRGNSIPSSIVQLEPSSNPLRIHAASNVLSGETKYGRGPNSRKKPTSAVLGGMSATLHEIRPPPQKKQRESRPH